MVAQNRRTVAVASVNPESNGHPKIVALRSVTDREDERQELFTIDGTSYSISTRPKLNAALKYLHLARTQGTEIAISYMLENLLGEEAYQALMDFEDLTAEQMEQIITIASSIMAGAVEAPKK